MPLCGADDDDDGTIGLDELRSMLQDDVRCVLFACFPSLSPPLSPFF